MAKEKITNKKLMDSIISESSETVKQGFKNIDTSDNQAVYETMQLHEDVRNGFINTLVNRCVKVQFFSKVYENPLKMLHNGMLPFGDSIQEIFVRLGERKGFNEHFSGSTTAEGDLIGKVVPTIDVDYIQQNYQHKYKVSISEEQLKMAFLNEGGLGQLISQLSSNNLSTAERDEYEDMKGLLTRKTEERKNGHVYPKGAIYQVADDTTIRDKAIVKCGDDMRTLCKNIRAYSKKLGFISPNYNLKHVPTWADKNELVFFTTPDVSADIDVNVLSQAFNVGMAEVQFRTIIVDELPKALQVNSSNVGDVIGVLADSNLIQSWDTINTSRHFENGDALYTNYFLHKHGIMSLCKFSQLVVFTNGK